MPFVKGVSGNPQGRARANEKFHERKEQTPKEIKDKEFKQILRRLKPLNTKAISKFEEMLTADSTSEAGRIKVAAFILKTYTDLMNDVYTTDSKNNNNNNEEDDKPQEQGALISFKRVDNV